MFFLFFFFLFFCSLCDSWTLGWIWEHVWITGHTGHLVREERNERNETKKTKKKTDKKNHTGIRTRSTTQHPHDSTIRLVPARGTGSSGPDGGVRWSPVFRESLGTYDDFTIDPQRPRGDSPGSPDSPPGSPDSPPGSPDSPPGFPGSSLVPGGSRRKSPGTLWTTTQIGEFDLSPGSGLWEVSG